MWRNILRYVLNTVGKCWVYFIKTDTDLTIVESFFDCPFEGFCCPDWCCHVVVALPGLGV